MPAIDFKHPTRTQKIILREVALGNYSYITALGSVRGGKTVGFSKGIIRHMLKFQNADFIRAGKTLQSLHRNVVPYIRQICRQLNIPCTVNRGGASTPPNIRIGNNNLYMFGGNNEASQDPLQGLTSYGSFCYEILLMPESFFDQVVARHSPDGTIVMCSGNKQAPSHWFKKKWV